MEEEVGIAPTTGQTCSRFQGGVLVYAGLLPMLAEGARFALAMGDPHLLSGQAPRLSGLPPPLTEMVRASGNAPDRWHSSSATPCIKRTVRL